MKTLKKALSVLLVAVMLLTAAPLSGFVGLELPELNLPEWNLPDFDFNLSADAADVVKSGTCGTNVTYTLDSDDVLTIAGTGAMRNYSSFSSVPWYSNRTFVKKIVIENGVTSIGNYAFCWCTSLPSVTIPDSVTSIGDYAFRECTSLTSVIIPDSVTSIGKYAFYNCTKLTSVTIPDNVTSIGDWAFSNCTSLPSVT
ncbi:MAG: leucine-rich repeat domain-containing protein, partial [Clostridia bacterium]|nr:leucine-rich repeat domain-containing protein [Clostridia bacterium]